MVRQFPGSAGVAVVDLTTGARFDVDGSAQFPAASTIKVPLLVALLELGREGVVDLSARVAVDERLVGSPVLGCLDDPVELSWRDLANLMIVVSDNTATNMIIDMVGYARMAEFLRSWGHHDTVLQRKMKDFEAIGRGEDNLSTPLDQVRILEMLWSEGGFAPEVSVESLRILGKTKKSAFRMALPSGTAMANKPGELPGVMNEMAIVFGPRPYGLSVMTSSGPPDVVQHVTWVAGVARGIQASFMKA